MPGDATEDMKLFTTQKKTGDCKAGQCRIVKTLPPAMEVKKTARETLTRTI
jgi:hypothetical protein